MRAIVRRVQLWKRYGRTDLWWARKPGHMNISIETGPAPPGTFTALEVPQAPWMTDEDVVEAFLWGDQELRKVDR